MKSSINVRGVIPGSEQHNNREKELNYVRTDLSNLNSSFNFQSVASAKQAVKEKYENTTGQKMQKKASPIREGVLLIAEHHTAKDLERLAQEIEKRFGIRTIQGYCHKDEGHYEKTTREWKPNYHAHMIFNWTDEKTGKSVRMNREDMAELQTIVAEGLGLERGQNSSKKHLKAMEYKTQQEINDLKTVYGLKNGLSEAKEAVKQAEPLRKEIEGLKTAKKGLEDETGLLRANRNFIEKKIELGREELNQINQKKQGLKF